MGKQKISYRMRRTIGPTISTALLLYCVKPSLHKVLKISCHFVACPCHWNYSSVLNVENERLPAACHSLVWTQGYSRIYRRYERNNRPCCNMRIKHKVDYFSIIAQSGVCYLLTPQWFANDYIVNRKCNRDWGVYHRDCFHKCEINVTKNWST